MKTFADFNIQIPYGATGEIDVVCPECDHTRKKTGLKDLSVNTALGTWLCHHCDWSGGLSDSKECKLSTDRRKRVYTLPTPPPKTDLPENVVTWFKDRGISSRTLDENRIGYGPVWMPQANKKVNAINFPYYDGETLINVKYRDGKKNFRMEKDAQRTLYGLNDISEDRLVWVEGEVDKLSFYEARIKSCVSVPDGAPSESTKNYTSKFIFLDEAEAAIRDVKAHVIAVDADAPGARLKAELIRRLGPEKCFVLDWPKGIKDANECIVKYGPGKLCELVAEAKPTPVNGLFTMDDLQSEILDFYDYGFEKGEKTGWPSVDEFYTVRVREWSVVTGIPGHGKSEWLDALLVNLAKNQGWRFGVCSMENHPISRHCAKIIEKYVGLPFRNTARLGKMDTDHLSEAINWMKEHFFFLYPDDDDMSLDGLLRLAQVLVYRYGIQGLVIDPWNEINHLWPKEQNEVMYISSALSKIRRFARRAGIHVWIVAHPTKLQKEKDGTYPPPTPYDISGAAHWRNKADNAITIHRPNIVNWKDPTVEIHVQKVRFKEIGKPGKAVLQYDYLTGRYNE